MEEKQERLAKIEFGKQVRAYRLAARISQGKLAEYTGLHQSYINYIENADTGVGIEKMVQISAAFGVKYYELANPNFPVPLKAVLRDCLKANLVARKIDPTFHDNKESPGYSSNMDIYLKTDKLNEAKSSYEIAKDYKVMFDEDIKPSKVSDILSKGKRKEIIEVSKPESGRGNLYRLKKKNTK